MSAVDSITDVAELTASAPAESTKAERRWRRGFGRTRWSTFHLALILLTLLSFFGCLRVATGAPPMIETDEAAHQSYVIALMHGQLPDIETPMIDDAEKHPYLHQRLLASDREHSTVWVANHPPLFHLIGVPFQAIGDLFGSPDAGLLALRILNCLFTAAMVLFTGLLARELVPRRNEIALLAAAVMAGFTVLTFLGGFVYNDGLLGMLTTWLLLMVVRCLRSGVSRRRLIAVAALAAAAGFTRVTALPMVALGTVGVVIAGLIHERGPGMVKRALVPGIVVAAAGAVVFGWFYLRNIVIYGDPTASAALLERFGREPHTDKYEYVKTILGEWERLFTHRLTPGDETWKTIYRRSGLVLAVGLAIGTVVRPARKLFRRPSSIRWLRRPEGLALLTGWSIAALFCVFLLVGFIGFVSEGGSPHVRYFLPMAPLIALVAALGAAGFSELVPGRARRIAAKALCLLAAAAVLTGWTLTQRSILVNLEKSVSLTEWGPGESDAVDSLGGTLWEPVGGTAVPPVFGWLAVICGAAALVLMALNLARPYRKPTAQREAELTSA